MKMILKAGWVLLGLAMAGGVAAGAQDEMGFARAKHLRRGINLSMWYAQDRDLYNASGGAEKLASYITADDFKLIHDTGFDHVRLSIDPEPLIADKTTGMLRLEALARLDETVKQITATGLVVVLDIHPEPAWVKASETAGDGTKQFFRFWTGFARHYASTDPEKVYFEVMNEPNGVDGYRWAGEQARAIALIRAEAPRHTIIATAASYGNIDALVAIEPVRDDNIVYSFHDYEPMEFTHQGATWAGDGLKPLRGVPYPSSMIAVEKLLPAITDAGVRSGLASYGEQQWTIDTMARRIILAVAWAKERHVPLWCGEFGVYRSFAPVADRARWISDMRTTLEADGVGWSMWDYRGSFGMIDKVNGVSVMDPLIVEALGLKGSDKR